jgi:hypothetical protein
VPRAGLCVALALLLAACTTAPPAPDTFSFAVIGDIPYNDVEEKQFLAMMRALDRQALAFVVHVGDFKAGSNAPCTDEIFERRRAQLDASAHPLILTPGDNDWTDCRRETNGAMDPVERLAKLRRMFFADRRSLGRSPIDTAIQDQCLAPAVAGCGCAAHPENRLWSQAGVRFATLNIPGSNNNMGFDAAGDEEARCRNEANRQWLERAVRESESADTRALVVAAHANPWNTRGPVYKDFLRQMGEAASRLGKPVLFVHGDTHIFRADTPFPTQNPRRLETYGSPFVGWVKVSVDPGDPELFRIEPRLIAIVPPVRPAP